MAEDKNDDSNEHKEEDEFGEEFDFEESHEDVLAPESDSGEQHDFGEPSETGEPSEDIHEMQPSSKPKNVMLPLVIGIAVLGFIGWKVYGIFTTPKTTEVKGGPKETQVEVAKVEPKIAPAAAPATTDISQPKTAIPNLYEAEQQAKQAVSDEKITAVLQKKIDEQLTAHKQQIDNIQKELSSANQNSTNAAKSVTALQQQVTTLSAAVQELSTQIKGMKDEQAAQIAKAQAEAEAARAKKAKPKTPKISTKSDAFTNPALSVHAIIPGRAWIRTPDGKTITVSEGDPIGQYGKVLKIDAPNGLVITTSGVTLR